MHLPTQFKEFRDPLAQDQHEFVVGLELTGSLDSLCQALMADVGRGPFSLACPELSVHPDEGFRLAPVQVEINRDSAGLEGLHDVEQFAHAHKQVVDPNQVVDGGIHRLLGKPPKVLEIVDAGGVVYSHCLSVARGVVYSRTRGVRSGRIFFGFCLYCQYVLCILNFNQCAV